MELLGHEVVLFILFFIDLKERKGGGGRRNRKRGRERQTDRWVEIETSIGCHLYPPQLGFKPAT